MKCLNFDVDFLEDGVGVEASFLADDDYYVTYHRFVDYPGNEKDECSEGNEESNEDPEDHPVGFKLDGTLLFKEDLV